MTRSKKIKASSGKARIGGTKIALPEVDYVTEADSRNVSLSDLSILLYGLAGTGKTTLSSEFKNTYHLMFDPGGKSLDVRQSQISHWLQLPAYLRKIAKDKSVDTVVVDGLDDAFDMCFRFMCDEVLMIDHPNDEKDYGKSWNAIYSEYFRQMYNAQLIPGKGCIYIGWAKESLYKTMEEEYTVIRPVLPSKVLERLLGKCEVCGYLYADGEQFKMRIRPNDSILAKCRPKKCFRYPDGSKISVIPMGDDSEVGYQNFIAAFKNKLEKEVKSKKKLKRKKLKK